MENLGIDNSEYELNKFYNGKTVLITGHTGFKGSWLCIWLNEMGAKVVGYALDPYSENDNFVVTGLKNKIVDIRGDIRDEEKLNDVFNTYRPEIVFHLAAQPLVRLSYEMPKDTYEINVMGTLNVLECIRKSQSVKVGIMITTDKCYENKEQIWSYRENDSFGGYDPYSSSKGCAELLIASYRNSYFNPLKYDEHGKSISSVRAGNVIGGGDWSKDRIIPDCMRALIKGEDIVVRNPSATRPWQHVLEPLSGYLLLGKKMYEDETNYCSGWNFGPDQESIVSVEKISNLVIDKWGKGRWVDFSKNEGPHEANFLSLDCTKAKVYLKWHPKLKIDEAIEYTIKWYKDYMLNCDMYNLCVNQIKQYCNF